MIPQDPFILLSYINMKLRDQFSDLDDFCSSENISVDEINEKLSEIGYNYSGSTNQFI